LLAVSRFAGKRNTASKLAGYTVTSHVAVAAQGRTTLMKIWRIIAVIIVFVCIGASLVWLPRAAVVGWGIGILVTLALCCVLERKLSKLEQRPFHIRRGQLELMPILWPLDLAQCMLTFYGLWFVLGRPSARYRRRPRLK
jgi:hypothetical protein